MSGTQVKEIIYILNLQTIKTILKKTRNWITLKKTQIA